ncbi:UDP-N-acetylmuramoylalanyl-D-glutamyl-2,6-diaminopimelate/D-alanyl-D-alanyl ligase [Dethiobacter alkaliphilus AHT 1]|uniref:UDP-N-acetylmuramoyl-tripeptide--D-alanyl-D-alanine ligase n=2 Tax=Dethiobacter TaxID=427925 RepID=C0GFU1_DETAL|nr:UDP-N-acetylmuramoylalanyl-D-glutamyl-2,6-diaminopimelate/D-alanyl-D-alanyl ligase [Dethiobacter alkaliphilus AHT 1]
MTLREISEAVGGKLPAAGDLDKKIGRVSIDSRDIGPGDFFVPLAGEHTDGHRFIAAAAEKGAAGCFAAFSKNVTHPEGMTVISVEDPEQALQDLSAFYRRKFQLPVVAVTGSVGKTTTKDMIAAALSPELKTLKTEGNLNNHLGVPLMLTRLDSTYEAAVLEMGMSGYGEIDLLAKLALPTVAVITNIGESHLEMLGSREGIARAKCELLGHLAADGVAVVNADEPLLVPHIKGLGCRVITFGFDEHATVRCTDIINDEAGKRAIIEQEGFAPLEVVPPLPGRHNIYNLMAALAVGRLLGVDDSVLTEGFSRVRLSGMRLETVTTPAGIQVINDAYNASPTAVSAAFDVLAELAKDAARFAVLGDMLELGDWEEEGHRQTGRQVARHNLSGLLVLGERAQLIADGAVAAGYPPQRVYRCESHAQAAQVIAKIARAGDWVLLKGSRGMRMEDVLAVLLEGKK